MTHRKHEVVIKASPGSLSRHAEAILPLCRELDGERLRCWGIRGHGFAKDVDEADVRGGCSQAAFGQNLYVAETGTNGWVRLSGLDASALPKAFALEPKTT